MDSAGDKRVLVIFENPLEECNAVGTIVSQYIREDVHIILLCPSCGKNSGVVCEDTWQNCDKRLLMLAAKLGVEVLALSYHHDVWVHESQNLMEYLGSMMNLIQPEIVLTSSPSDLFSESKQVGLSEIVTQAYNQFYNKGLLMYACVCSTQGVED